MVPPIAFLLIGGGVCACAPLFRHWFKVLGRILSIAGFFVGVGVIIVAAEQALQLGLFQSFATPTPSQITAKASYLGYYLPLMMVLGVLLFSRPIRNVRWASLISLAAGLLVAYYVSLLFGVTGTTILGVIFLVTTVVIYLFLRFIEDLFEFVGQVLAFPPVAVAIGLAAIYFGIIIAINFP